MYVQARFDWIFALTLSVTAPSHIRRRAIGYMATYETDSGALVFPHRQRTRLRVSLRMPESNGSLSLSHNTIVSADDGSLDGSLRAAQQEIVEQEIFAVLIKEAGNLPTASARVSERLIVIDAAQRMELLFELVRDWRLLLLFSPNIFCRLTKKIPCHFKRETKRPQQNAISLLQFYTRFFYACTHT
jgi:Subunit 17 of Mediator complex